MPGRLDMLARVGLIQRSRVGDFMPDGGDPFSGWPAGAPENGAACDSKPLLCVGLVLHSLCHADAQLVNVVAFVRARGRDVPTSDGRVRRWAVAWRAAGRRSAIGLPGSAEVGLISGAL
jgi:hypothetical protein